MSTLVKSHWIADGDNIRLSMPLTKVDEENRRVSGFATLDNVDSQGDVVLAEASKEAFAKARGNLREMHGNVAAGYIVDFKEEEFFHDGQFYRGIYVTAYVSKGAPDTWEKVLDGTLTGFSIGGNITEASNEFVKEQNKSVRFIKSYDLVELSLVDNPANQLANVFSITKSSTGQTLVKGMVMDVKAENVFYCQDDDVFKAAGTETATCLTCDKEMTNIGWFESGPDRAEKVRDVVTKFLGSNAANNDGEGGVEEMSVRKAADNEEEGLITSEDVTNPVPEGEAKAEQTENVNEVDESTEETTDDEAKAEAVEETPEGDEEISKKLDSLKDSIHESLEKTRTENSAAIAALEKKLEENKETFLTKVSDLESRFSEVGESLETTKANQARLEKSFESLNSEESFKKSGDVESPEKVQKNASDWDGTFSINGLLKK
jgi:hypothetical protein